MASDYGAFDPPFLHACKKRRGFHSQKLGSASRTLDLPIGLFQNGQKVVALAALKLCLSEERGGAAGRNIRNGELT